MYEPAVWHKDDYRYTIETPKFKLIIALVPPESVIVITAIDKRS